MSALKDRKVRAAGIFAEDRNIMSGKERTAPTDSMKRKNKVVPRIKFALCTMTVQRVFLLGIF